jgi:hypothetical protein
MDGFHVQCLFAGPALRVLLRVFRNIVCARRDDLGKRAATLVPRTFDRNLSDCYLGEMQTTLRFDEALMRRIKAEAAHQGMSLTRYIEGALRERLRRRRPANRETARKIKLPVSRAKGGFAPGIADLKQARKIIEDGEAARLLKRPN